MFGGDSEKWDKLNDPEFRSARRLAPLFEALEKAQAKEHSDEEGMEGEED